ncbi:MAG: hypothetical protein QFC55_02670 [Chloroflexota bacterium]|nr:hypothetical protein [Chloroflexota bacterium]
MGLVPGRPELYSTRTRSAWRLPALAVVAVLLGVVVLTRVGGSDRPTGNAPASTATPVPTATLPRGWSTPSFDPSSYADGIPLEVGGQPVFRVSDAVLSPVGRTLQVGGWYIDRSYFKRECAARRGAQCAPSTMSDVPLVGQYVGDVLTSFVAIDATLGSTGAYVLLATVEVDPGCWIHAAGSCQPWLHVIGRVWSGLG